MDDRKLSREFITRPEMPTGSHAASEAVSPVDRSTPSDRGLERVHGRRRGVPAESIGRRARSVAAFAIAGMLSMVMISTPARGGTPLPACPVMSKWPVKPVSADVVAALTKYYSARHLTPVSVYGKRETVLDVKKESVGVHWCRNLDGSKSGYVGVVPKNATAAVMVHVKHRPYPVTQAASTFVTLAKIPSKGWKVVSDDTGP